MPHVHNASGLLLASQSNSSTPTLPSPISVEAEIHHHHQRSHTPNTMVGTTVPNNYSTPTLRSMYNGSSTQTVPLKGRNITTHEQEELDDLISEMLEEIETFPNYRTYRQKSLEPQLTGYRPLPLARSSSYTYPATPSMHTIDNNNKPLRPHPPPTFSSISANNTPLVSNKRQNGQTQPKFHAATGFILAPNQESGSTVCSTPISVEVEVHHRSSTPKSTVSSSPLPQNYSKGSIVNGNRHRSPNGQISNGQVNGLTNGLTNGSTNGHHVSRREQDELDQLLSGMLKEVECFPDYHTLRPKDNQIYGQIGSQRSTPARSFSYTAASPRTLDYSPIRNQGPYSPTKSLNSPQWPDNAGKRYLTRPDVETDRSRPYHARPDCQPFTYGVTAASPIIQRRRVHSESTAYVCENKPRKDADSQPIYAQIRRRPSYGSPDPIRETNVPEATLLASPGNDSSVLTGPDQDMFSDTASSGYLDSGLDDPSLTWLQRQQLKLKVKKDMSGHEERNWREQRLLSELRGTVSSRKVPAHNFSRESSPADTSFSEPLHVNTSTSLNHVGGGGSASGGSPVNATILAQRQHSAPNSTSPFGGPPNRSSSHNLGNTLNRTQSVNYGSGPTGGSRHGGTTRVQKSESGNAYDRAERPLIAIRRAMNDAYSREQTPLYGTVQHKNGLLMRTGGPELSWPSNQLIN